MTPDRRSHRVPPTARLSRSRPSGAHATETALELPTSVARRGFGARLLSWYRRHGRTLPWRTTDDPYHILVSEVMLQQTQVDRVLPKYHEWLDKYPSLAALAAAHEDEVVRTWYPLGYNIRPRRLQTIAREAVARFDGRLPGGRRRRCDRSRASAPTPPARS